MSERKQQGKFIPLRLRFRSPSEQARWDRDYHNGSIEEVSEVRSNFSGNTSEAAHTSTFTEIPVVDIAHNTTQQSVPLKELLNLSQLLRTELPLSDILQHVALSISTSTGFRAVAIRILEEYALADKLTITIGLSEKEQQIIRNNALTLQQLQRVMQPEFRISQSYFIPHKYVISDLADVVRVVTSEGTSEEDGQWHQEDMLLIPLFGLRQQQIIGIVSLDDPENGHIPTLEQIEMLELFANQAAIAIDNESLLEQQEAERMIMGRGITQLREDIRRVRLGNLQQPARTLYPELQPVVDELNMLLEESRTILERMQGVTEAVDEHTRYVQRSSEFFVRDTAQQQRLVHQISYVLQDMKETMKQIAGRATDLSKMAVEAMEMTMGGQHELDRAIEGMGKMRETTLSSSRVIKRLHNSGQEINDALIAMNDLTTRMHLLALNAAIEAARAGEPGKGFSVIAHELRTLASYNSEGMHKAENYIRMLQQEMSILIKSIDQNIEQVVLQTELVTQTGAALEGISVVTGQMAHLIQNICAEAEGQAQGSEQVVGTVGEVLNMANEIKQHMSDMQHSLSPLLELSNGLRARMLPLHVTDN